MAFGDRRDFNLSELFFRPFGDLDFVQSVMEIHPEFKMNKTGMGKWLLRKAFDGMNLMPEEILWRYQKT